MWNVSKLQSIDIISIICTILFISWILKIIFIHFTLVCAWYMCSLFFVAVAAKAMLISFFGGIHILNTAQHCHNHNLQEYKYTFDVSSNFRCLFSYNFFLFYQSGWVFLRVRVQKDEIQSGCAEAKVTKLIREWMSYHDSRICTYAVIKKENHFFPASSTYLHKTTIFMVTQKKALFGQLVEMRHGHQRQFFTFFVIIVLYNGTSRLSSS